MRFIRSKWKIILCMLIAMLGFCILAACSSVYLPEENGYTALVVYDANGGRYSNADTTGIKTFKYKPSVRIMEPGGGQNSQFTAPIMNSKHVAAWYPAILDENGQPTKDAEGAYVLEEEPWDFATDRLPREDGFKLYLVAFWAMNYTVTVDVGEEARADGVENVIYTNYTEAGPIYQPGINPSWSGHTFYYYSTEDGKRLSTTADWNALVLSDENPSITIYAHWLEGNWKIVTSADDLKSISSAQNYILDTDIDLGGGSFKLESYRGIFDGNGYTISNFKTEDSTIISASSTSFGICNFYLNGCIRNVTFKDATYTVSLYRELTGVNARYKVGFLCGDGSDLDLSKFENIGFVNCSLTVSKFAGAIDAEVVTGSGTYAGIFGALSEEQTFVPAEGSTAITITI